MLNNPDEIERLLNEIIPKSPIKLGLKVRMGYESTDEILKVIPVLNQFPITELIIHARYAKQLYKPSVDLDRFKECISLSKIPLTYNGDIKSVADFNKLKLQFPTINNWMIGRGVVSDPFLPSMIKEGVQEYPKDRLLRFRAFHDELFQDYESVLSGDRQVLLKMESFWEYFAQSFYDSHKTYKRIKKSKNLQEYNNAVNTNFEIERDIRGV